MLVPPIIFSASFGLNDSKLCSVLILIDEFVCPSVIIHNITLNSPYCSRGPHHRVEKALSLFPLCSASWACCLWAQVTTWLVFWVGEACATTTLSCCRSWRSWREPPPKCWTGETSGRVGIGVGKHVVSTAPSLHSTSRHPCFQRLLKSAPKCPQGFLKRRMWRKCDQISKCKV